MTGLHFLLVSFDGLRPDLVSDALTPNIRRLAARGVTLARHRTVYPSETRVAFPSLVTGATPDRHGMIGNKYVDRAAAPPRYLDTSDAELLDRLDRESGGRLMGAPTLGEILAVHGRSLAVLATNTPGTTRLFHHKAEQFGHIRLSGHFKEACTPAAVLAAVEARFGALPPLPPKGEPDIDAQALITSTFLEIAWPQLRPDVTILSYGEPDICSHLNGTGAAKTREAIAVCDNELGRLLDWWEAEGAGSGVQIILLSDHGHVSGHTRVSVADTLRKTGFSPGPAPAADVDAVIVPGQVGAIYLADHSLARLSKAVEAITAEPWCGCVFTAPGNEVDGVVAGTFSTGLIAADHDRAPDISFAFWTDDSIDPFGLPGGTYYDNDRRAGLGLHGGLHPKELAALGVLAGSAFRSDDTVSLTPSGICDFAPTMLHLLGIAPPLSMSGRVLVEALAGGAMPDDPQPPSPVVFETGHGTYRQALRRVRVGSTVYIDGGWAGPDAEEAARQNRAWG